MFIGSWDTITVTYLLLLYVYNAAIDFITYLGNFVIDEDGNGWDSVYLPALSWYLLSLGLVQTCVIRMRLRSKIENSLSYHVLRVL